ncbi:YihY/virulence factor BrkB family protein, partial [Microvirga brassicacearum]
MTSEFNSPESERSSSTTSTIGAAVLGLLILKFLGPREHTPSDRSRERDASAGFADKQHADSKRAQQERGIGRHASSPEKIPPRGWKDILWRTYEEVGKDRIMAVAAGVTYYALLAIFPAIAALVSMYGLFADPNTIQEHLGALSEILPGGALEIVGEQVKRIAAQGTGTLGVSFLLGLLIAIWSANAGMKAIFDALNIVYDEDEKRSFLKLNAVSLAFTAGALAFVLIALAAIVVLPIAVAMLGLGSGVEWALRLGRWPILLACVVAGLAVLYRYGPSRDRAQW